MEFRLIRSCQSSVLLPTRQLARAEYIFLSPVANYLAENFSMAFLFWFLRTTVSLVLGCIRDFLFEIVQLVRIFFHDVYLNVGVRFLFALLDLLLAICAFSLWLRQGLSSIFVVALRYVSRASQDQRGFVLRTSAPHGCGNRTFAAPRGMVGNTLGIKLCCT